MGQRGKLPLQCIALWRGVLYGAVPADRAGAWTARRRAATPPLDCDTIRGRTDCGRPRHLQTTLREENEMALPRDIRSMAVRYGLSTMAASLALVFGSFLPLNAQPKAPEVTVAN